MVGALGLLVCVGLRGGYPSVVGSLQAYYQA
jgi:hypothetical protein